MIPQDANHHGTLYAGALLRLALEAGYATAYRQVGGDANLLLRRVLSVECNRPVPVGTLVEIRGRALEIRRAYLVVGLIGTPLQDEQAPWMEGLMGFVQVDESGKACALPEAREAPSAEGGPWRTLRERLDRLGRGS